MTAVSSQKLTQENSYKENTLPLGPQAEETMFSNPHPFPIDYGFPPPMYCANASTLPKSEKSMGTVSTCLSNTLPPGYTPNYGVPFVPSYSVSLPNPTVNTQAPNQKLLLYDPATGLLYDQSQQPQPISLTEKASTIPSQKYNTLHDSGDSDTSSESSFSSDYSRERRRSKNKPVAKKRKANPTKRRRQNKPNRRRRKRKR